MNRATRPAPERADRAGRELAAIADRLDGLEALARAAEAERRFPCDREAEHRVVAVLLDCAGRPGWRTRLAAQLLEADLALLIWSADLRAVALAAQVAHREGVEASREFVVAAVVGAGVYIPRLHDLVSELQSAPIVCHVDKELERLRGARRRREALRAMYAAARHLRDPEADEQAAALALGDALSALEERA